MGERWTAAQVASLAPDAASQKAGTKLGVPGPWSETGFHETDRLLWGDCKGSGSKPYQVTVSVSDTDIAYQCTCPSRKFPCKHGLGLLLLWSTGTIAAAATLPARVQDWSRARTARTEKAAARGERKAEQMQGEPASGDQRTAERTAQRHERIGNGLTDLERWLTDQVAAGVASGAGGHGASGVGGYASLDPVAKRLVDAQAPGVAAKVRALASIRLSGDAWPDTMLTEFAQLHLLCEAWSRLDELPAALRDTVKRRVGIAVDAESVKRDGRRVSDRWQVLGSKDRQLEKLTERRVWLRGQESGRIAMLMAFGVAQAAPVLALPVGAVYEAEFAFHSEAVPMRVQGEPSRPDPGADVTPPGGTLAEAAEAYAAALAADPWTTGLPVVVRDAVPVRVGAEDWRLTDGEGWSVRMGGGESFWTLLAVSGGHPVTVFGEFSDAAFEPLTVWAGDRALVL